MSLFELFELITLRIEEFGLSPEEMVVEAIDTPQYPEADDIEVVVNGNRVIITYAE